MKFSGEAASYLKKFVSFAVEKSHWSWIAVDPKLYQCLFEIGLCITKEGGMAVSAVLRLVHLLAPYPSEPWYPPPHTGGTPVPLSKSPKGIGFWY